MHIYASYDDAAAALWAVARHLGCGAADLEIVQHDSGGWRIIWPGAPPRPAAACAHCHACQVPLSSRSYLPPAGEYLCTECAEPGGPLPVFPAAARR